ncbi:MAG: class I SAM-dependent methyltransferase [Pseudomonadota bacterium]
MSELPNADQRAFWSEEAGHKWVAQQSVMDALLAPVLEGLLDRAQLSSGDHVLDIGCGAGTSTMRAATLVRPAGSVTGVDISDTLLALADQRAEGKYGLTYLHADAATYDFEARSFDHVVSRFGVMFFDDPTLAFSNIFSALSSGAHVNLATWGAIDENPYFKLAAKAARSVLGPMPKSDPDAPGPFSMRDPERVIPTLRDSGMKEVQADRQHLLLTPSGTLEDFADICTVIGPAEAAMRHFEATEEQRTQVHESLVETFAPFVSDTGAVEIPAEIIFYSARA